MNLNVLKDIKKLILKYEIDCRRSNSIIFILSLCKNTTDEENLETIDIKKFTSEFKRKKYFDALDYEEDLSEDFLEFFSNEIGWNRISSRFKLSEKFIEQHQDKVNWNSISFYQVLSEYFIEKYQDKLDWSKISIKQKLSKEFIEKFQDKLNLGHVAMFQKSYKQISGNLYKGN